jgi:hypothetical protein
MNSVQLASGDGPVEGSVTTNWLPSPLRAARDDTTFMDIDQFEHHSEHDAQTNPIEPDGACPAQRARRQRSSMNGG